MVEKCEGCKPCGVDIKVLEEFEESEINFYKIASYLGGTITEKEGNCKIRLGKEYVLISGRKPYDGGLISVAVMRSEKLFVSNHIISGVNTVKFSTALASRGKTKQEVKNIVLQNEKGRIIIQKEKNKYIIISLIFGDVKEK